ncbi:alpha/beta fold hydrolase [Hamadaea tsunoensis]|uniref:alpha/beta fold hydrolase n=1 Tax=Hamadaea tsunoensis TaxID=53368 RepID=UPI00042A7859|nr:alpha/beta hydrolase [Hamadaea tsunoensis]
MVINEFDVELPDGGVLHAYDSGTGDVAVCWHHGTPNIGTPPAPLYAAAERLGLRWIAYDRPGYGGSAAAPDRPVGSAARYTAAVADALGIGRLALFGHSGGGTHALGAAALLGDRITAVVSAAGVAPFGVPGLDWYSGMNKSGLGSLTAAACGRAAKESWEASGVEYDSEFTAADFAAFEAGWGWFGSVVGPALAGGRAPLIDDDLAYVRPWGCDPAQITAPVLLLHGELDHTIPSSHAVWLADRIAGAELRLSAQDSHISIMTSGEAALEWIAATVSRG